MNKKATTERPLIEVIQNRWSPRAFQDKAIAQEDLETIFEAARWAPSCANEQNWEFVYAHRADTQQFQQLCTLLQGGNNAWAPQAAVLVVSLARKNFAASGKPNRHALHDVGLATQNLLLQAMSMKVYGHPMAGFDVEKTIALLALDEAVEPVCMIALGYLGEPEMLEDPFLSREKAERVRKPLSEVCRAFKDKR